ncbi:MAG: metallophosphatase family protein [Betaproteobacteria bacterium HGW-Betaproteobacteria-7]|jgi:exonuclease SbcD|uniref:metallophosphoesterase family protein n=1 Tax=Accumulibacter sp. TaxID=2053492 RepID=UPI000CC3861D|nr:MAG: metallophosphatase family protein [Betaproteobacteria bacterium HGW-Betaproteobacteria-7]
MIRIAHFSDLHYGTKNQAEADRCFGAAIDRAIALGVEAAVLSGDATDHALDLHAPAAERLFAQVRRLADHCPVLMLQGTFSHEPPGTLAIFKLLGGRYPVHVAERIEQVALTAQGQWLVSAGWCFDQLPAGARALFSCVPTVNKAAVATAVGAADAAQAVGEHLAILVRGFVPINRAARLKGLPTIGVSHGTVFGCLSEHGVPMAGFDHEFTTGALFAAEAQAFMLGHIHRHQFWERESRTGRQCVAYPGSIGRFHYGEEGEKGFLVWEVDADQAHFAVEPTPARRTIDIVFDGKPDLDTLRTTVSQQDVAGAFVRVRWTVADEDRHEVDRRAIERLLEGAAETKLEGRIVPVVRTRAAGISQLAHLADKVRVWAQVTEVQLEPMLTCLQTLSTQEPEAIVEHVLRRQDIPCDVSSANAEPMTDLETVSLF